MPSTLLLLLLIGGCRAIATEGSSVVTWPWVECWVNLKIIYTEKKTVIALKRGVLRHIGYKYQYCCITLVVFLLSLLIFVTGMSLFLVHFWVSLFYRCLFKKGVFGHRWRWIMHYSFASSFSVLCCVDFSYFVQLSLCHQLYFIYLCLFSFTVTSFESWELRPHWRKI